MLLDDDALMLYIKSKMLMQKGYEVSTSPNAVDIITQVVKYDPDVIIMDHNMPMISGVDAIKQLKADARTNNIPVIFFSLVDNITELAKEAGADAYASKACRTDDIITIIERLVKK